MKRRVEKISRGSRILRVFRAAGLIAVIATGCAIGQGSTSSPILRAAIDVPERFVLTRGGMMARSDTMPGTGCRSPLYDARDETAIIMMRSAQAHGDYAVPAGRYGVAGRELLRVECNSGRPLGIVQR